MQSSSLLLLRCPEPGCNFTYNPDRPAAYKNHKAGVHVHSVKVNYCDPVKETVILRTDGGFYCERCPYKSNYPNVIQVSIYLLSKIVGLLNKFFIETRQKL
jgi:hypothetical protein